MTTIYQARKIVTMNPSRPVATHVAVRDGQILGAGNLASAIVRGLLAKQVYAPAEIGCTSKTGVTAQKLSAETGIGFEPDLPRLLADADLREISIARIRDARHAEAQEGVGLHELGDVGA